MKLSFVLAAAAVLGAAFALLSAAPAEEDSVIRVDVRVVNVLATVRDKKGVLISDLAKDDFILEEDGERQEIRYFSRQSDLPLTVGLLVDTSVSQQRLLSIERAASYEFLDKLLRLRKDLAFLISFDIDIELLQDLTDSKTLLSDALEQLQIQGAAGGMHPSPVPTGGRKVGTAMYDSIYLACDEILKRQVGRKALVLVSDGNDYGSRVSRDEAIAAAHRTDTVVYAVRYFDRRFYFRSGAYGSGGAGALKRIARETGGTMFEVSRKRPLKQILEQINQELRNQYSIGYTPKRDLSVQGFRKIKLRVKRKGLKVNARSGYYAEALAD